MSRSWSPPSGRSRRINSRRARLGYSSLSMTTSDVSPNHDFLCRGIFVRTTCFVLRREKLQMAKVVTALRSATEKAVSAGKVALITGGTSGIGAATARRMAELGAKVVITGRRQREGRRLVGDIRRNGGCAAFFPADLSRSDEARRIVPFTIETFGRLDYAFNNAGISGDNRLLVDQTEENFDRVFAVNVKALFLLLQDEVKQMLAQGRGGSIVNAASVAGLLATPTAGPYVASKHAVLGLTKTAAVEYGRYGIRVNAVSPGAVRTEMLLAVFGSEEVDRMGAVHPIGRIGRPEEIADAVAWLFSNESSYFSGQSLTLDGGLTAQRPRGQGPVSKRAAEPGEERAIGQDRIASSDPQAEAIAH
jgi:A-factor type gamma-butyrolactone 1'-reductase (1S-forming)